jgi:WD40 repeat protein
VWLNVSVSSLTFSFFSELKGRTMRTIYYTSGILIILLATAFSSNNTSHPDNLLATANATQKSEAAIKVLQVAKGAIFDDVVWSPDFQWLAVASCKALFIYQTNEMNAKFEIPTPEGDCVTKIAFGTNDIFAFNTNTGRLEIWSAASQKKLASLDFGKTALALAFSTKTSELMVGSYDGISLWDIKTYNKKLEFSTIPSNFRATYSMAFDPTALTVAIETPAGVDDASKNSVTLWNVHTKARLVQLDTEDVVARSLAFSPDESLLAVGSETGTIQLWNIKTGKLTATLGTNDNIVGCLAFSPDGKYVAGASSATVTVWNIESRDKIASLSIDTHYTPALTFNKDGSAIVLGTEDQVGVWKYK